MFANFTLKLFFFLVKKPSNTFQKLCTCSADGLDGMSKTALSLNVEYNLSNF